MTSRQETRSGRRWILVALVIFLLCLVLWIAAALILNIAFAESLPFSLGLRSRLAANYGPDEFVGSLGIFRLSIIDEVLLDRGLPPEEIEERSEKIKEAMGSPVPTATARDFKGKLPFTATLTEPPTATSTATPTETPTLTKTVFIVLTATDIVAPASKTPALPTKTPTTGPSKTPSKTASPTPAVPSVTPTSGPSSTPTPTPTLNCSLITITDFEKNGDRVQWTITNGSLTDITIEGISLAWPAGNGRLEYIVLDLTKTIWDLKADPPQVIITSGWTGESRVISVSPPSVYLEFDFDYTAQPNLYPMSVTFDNGCVVSPPISTSTPTPSSTPNPTFTPTSTNTATQTPTPTSTNTATQTPTPTSSPTSTPLTPAACIAGSVIIPTTGDAWIDRTAPGANNGFDSNLHVKPTVFSDHQSLIQFGLTAIPSPCTTVITATLRIYQKDSDDQTIEVFRIIQPWSESMVTWANAPNYSATPWANFNGSAFVPTFRNVDITALVQDWVDGTDNHGLLLKSSTGSVDIQFSSREGSYPPELIVDYGP